MEERTLLSQAPIRIGSLGDSVSDEYQFYAPYRTAAANWVEILSALRPTQVTFGAFSTTTRGETRNQGYAQDWARSGASAVGPDVVGAHTTLIDQYNGYTKGNPPVTYPGLLTQPGGLSNIDVATLLVGGNDYQAYLTKMLATIASTTGAQLGAANTIGQFLTTQLENLTGLFQEVGQGVFDALNAITKQDPTIPIVVVSPPDLEYTPIAVTANATLNSLLPNNQDALKTLLRTTAGLIDSTVEAIANGVKEKTDPNVRFVNLDKYVITPIVTNPYLGGDSKTGTYIDPTAAGPSYTDLFVGDSFHPGTVGQALLANEIGKAINSIPSVMSSHAAIATLSTNEILACAQKTQPVTKTKLTAAPASVTLGSPVTLFAQVFNFPNIDSTTLTKNFDMFPPTGSVEFVDVAQGNKIVGVANLIPQGKGPTYTESDARFTTSSLGAGLHQIIAIYNGDSVYPAATTAAVQVNVGKGKLAQIFTVVTQLQSQLGVQVAEPQLLRWNKQLSHAARPRLVARSIMNYLYVHTKLPHGQATTLLEKARHSLKLV
jgi:hypothetical protein